MTHRKPKKAAKAFLLSAAPPPLSDFRALTLFERLSPEHMTFRVPNAASAPHLKEGEYAVVDLSDRDPQPGELYVIQFEKRRAIVQAKRFAWSAHWYVGDLRGYSEEKGIIYGWCDGPYRTKLLQSRLIGRVVGFALSPLGDLLAPAAEVAPPPAARQAQVSAAGGDMPDCLQRWLNGGVVREEQLDPKRS